MRVPIAMLRDAANGARTLILHSSSGDLDRDRYLDAGSRRFMVRRGFEVGGLVVAAAALAFAVAAFAAYFQLSQA